MKALLFLAIGWLSICCPLAARPEAAALPEQASNTAAPAAAGVDENARVRQQLSFLMDTVAAQGRRIKELEDQVNKSPASVNVAPQALVAALPPAEPAQAEEAKAEAADPHDHMIKLPGGGPELKIRGFMDFSADAGQAANHLIFPLGVKAHNSFQSGEFDLFLSSKLSDHISFVSEIVIGSDATNSWGLDIERLQLTYRPSRYFEISGGRYHTAIGYYNTAFHHGTWFQTATGRPFMYYFEDSGGLLPVHEVGVTTTGLLPGTGRWNLHWVAETGNGRSSSTLDQPVQNFLSDRNHKAVNFALYIKPEWAPGLQIGGSYYRDRLFPPTGTSASAAKVSQNIESAYIVWNNSRIESLNECVLMNNELESTGKVYRTPMCYAQISERFHNVFRPYFRYQYVNSPNDDPLNSFTGRYQGPSVGIRFDFTAYVALKVQYNRVDQRDLKALNGLQAQAAFAF